MVSPIHSSSSSGCVRSWASSCWTTIPTWLPAMLACWTAPWATAAWVVVAWRALWPTDFSQVSTRSFCSSSSFRMGLSSSFPSVRRLGVCQVIGEPQNHPVCYKLSIKSSSLLTLYNNKLTIVLGLLVMAQPPTGLWCLSGHEAQCHGERHDARHDHAVAGRCWGRSRWTVWGWAFRWPGAAGAGHATTRGQRAAGSSTVSGVQGHWHAPGRVRVRSHEQFQ